MPIPELSQRRDPIVVLESDPGWAASFEEQRALLTPCLDAVLARPIEHIGSTAVPGLPAKPIVDMLAAADQHDRPAYRAGKAPFIQGVLTELAP